MSTTQEDVVRRLIEVGFNEGNLAVADELIASDMTQKTSHIAIPWPNARAAWSIGSRLPRIIP